MVSENEAILHENGQWLYFSRPLKTLTAYQPGQVLPTLQMVEGLVETHGWHAVGFVSYEAAPAFDPALQTHPAGDFPLVYFSLYDNPRVISLPAPSLAVEPIHWQPDTTQTTYQQAIRTIKAEIAAGNTYQVNYTLRLRTQDLHDPWQAFLRLAQAQQAGHEAYLDIGRWVIACASPELFFNLDKETITCRPMKGTVQRGLTLEQDRSQANWLHHSEKNRAENVMIVDMIRNDLGRFAETGSVQTPHLFTTERYPTLWQMTSTVTARSQARLAEMFSHLFPCASITGAPKVSTMKIIRRLETSPRRIYTGSIGHIAPGRQAVFNVAIRTVLHDRQDGKSEYGAGGGIVWDSTITGEYEEALLKARVLSRLPQPPFQIFETLLWEPGTGYFLLEKHLQRLMDSAEYFGFPISRTSAEEELSHLAANFGGIPQRTRLTLAADGRLATESAPLGTANKPVLAGLAKSAVSSTDISLHHKTSQRDVYTQILQELPNAEDVILINERGELTEFTIGNLVLELDRKKVTPPVSSGLLGGVFRAHLLENNEITEQVLTTEDLRQATNIFRINSVRRWQAVKLVIDEKT